LRAAGITIRPQTKGITQGQVRILGPTEFLITSFRGPLELTMDNAALVVPEGTIYRVVLGDSQGPPPVGAGAEDEKRAKFTAFLIFILTTAGIVVPVTLENLHGRHQLVSPIFP
jgi:hypothetical protein